MQNKLCANAPKTTANFRQGLVFCIALVLAPTSAQGQQDESSMAPVVDVSDNKQPPVTTAQETAEPVAAISAKASTTASTEPIDNIDTARPSLDYEPSETISEDSSVSFPVDI